MTTKILVLYYNNEKLSSNCLVISDDEYGLSKGREIWIDLTVNADFGESPESELVGKTIIIDRLQPFEFIGIGCRIVEEVTA